VQLEPITGGNISAELNGSFGGKVPQVFRIERSIEGNAHFLRPVRPGEHRLRQVLSGVADLVEFALTAGSAAPVRPAAVHGDDQVSLWRNTGIDRQHVKRGEQLISGNVTGAGLDELSAVEFAARIAGYQGVGLPPRWAEHRAAVHRIVECQSASR